VIGIGLIGFGVGVLGGNACGGMDCASNRNPETGVDYWAEIEKHHDRLTKDKCSRCRFYNNNDFLPCAINLELKYNCSDFDPIEKN